MRLNTPISLLTKVGKVTAGRLKILGLKTVEDLIFYFPFRYEDFSQIKTVNELQEDDIVTIKVKIQLIANRRSFRKRKIITEALVADHTGEIKIVWFNQPFLTKVLKAGDEVFLSGKVDIDHYGVQMVGPNYEKVKSDDQTIHTARLVPIYSLTKGITEKQFRFLLSQVTPVIKNISERLPRQIVEKNDLLDLSVALENIHFPQSREIFKKAIFRLQFEELFLIQLKIQQLRRELDDSQSFELKFLEKPTKDFVASLPFELTADQKKSAWQILQDMQKSRPMNRLLEGDVGSGKTVVVALAVLNVILNGYKSVVMAPTEILAKQHFDNFNKFFSQQNFKIMLFTRGQKFLDEKKLTKNNALDILRNGQVDMVIGTQALIQDGVKIKDLGLVVIDEQHRFGVKQRKNLVDKRQEMTPHFLSMTATPIPRTLSLALYGDLDLSIIKQMPTGRLPIITRLVKEHERVVAYDFIKKQLVAGRQVFVLCPLIDPSDNLGMKSVTEEFEKLDKIIFPNFNIGLMHGKLKAEQKEHVMKDFLANKFQILVSTSVIEVGIDVPNATVMMIEGADRFGLAQLHQFRGRVGRSGFQSYCLLFSENESQATIKRLNYFVKSKDGFDLAQKDLDLRGAGEVYGTKQSGLPDLKIADLSDLKMIESAQKSAKEFLTKNNPDNFEQLKNYLEKLKINLHFE